MRLPDPHPPERLGLSSRRRWSWPVGCAAARTKTAPVQPLAFFSPVVAGQQSL